jgi:hypothetical protein
MRLARLGLIGAVLLVALHAFLFANGEGHHGNPVPTTSMAEGSVQHDGARVALWSSVQLTLSGYGRVVSLSRCK